MKWIFAVSILLAAGVAAKTSPEDGEEQHHLRNGLEPRRSFVLAEQPLPGWRHLQTVDNFCEDNCKPANQGGCPSECTCMGDEAVRFGNLRNPTSFGCTSNDVRVASTELIEVRDEGMVIIPGPPYSCNEGEDIFVQIEANLENGANSRRSDIGIWLSNDGEDAESGSCSHFYFEDPNPTSPDPTPPILNNIDDNPPDTCGDLDGGQEAGPLPLTDTMSGSSLFKVKCIGDAENKVTVPSCIGWKVPGADEQCDVDYNGDGVVGNEQDIIFGTLPATKSKCRCGFIQLDIDVKRQPAIAKTCDNPQLLEDFPGQDQFAIRWHVSVDITNNNNNQALTNWEVTDSPIDFDVPLTSPPELAIAAMMTETYTRTITEALPTMLNTGFVDTVTLSSTASDFSDETASANCPPFTISPAVLEVTANCDGTTLSFPADGTAQIVVSYSGKVCNTGGTRALGVIATENNQGAQLFGPVSIEPGEANCVPFGPITAWDPDDPMGTDPCTAQYSVTVTAEGTDIQTNAILDAASTFCKICPCT